MVRDDIAVALGYDSWADYDVAYELVHVDGCLMNRNDLDVEALIADLELIGETWLERHTFDVDAPVGRLRARRGR